MELGTTYANWSIAQITSYSGYKIIFKANDLISRYAFGYQMTRSIAATKTKVLMDVMARDAYSPTVIIRDEILAFISQAIHVIAAVFGITSW